MSQYLAQQLRQFLPATNPKVIPCGVTLPSIHANFSDQPFRVVYSGRMVERQKCIHQVVHTLIQACQVSSQIKAHLIGDGAERAACENLVRQAGLAGRIHFHGRIPTEQVQPLLLRSQAILLMSDFEGLPVALLEAMAAGAVPVVRAIESGIPELVLHERTGLLVDNDPAEAAAQLVRLSGEPPLWQHCSTNSRALVQEGYDANRCFDRWLALIDEQCAPTRPAFPIRTSGLRQTLPLTDPRFSSHYPTCWSRLHPRRLLGRLRRGVAQILKATLSWVFGRQQFN